MVDWRGKTHGDLRQIITVTHAVPIVHLRRKPNSEALAIADPVILQCIPAVQLGQGNAISLGEARERIPFFNVVDKRIFAFGGAEGAGAAQGRCQNIDRAQHMISGGVNRGVGFRKYSIIMLIKQRGLAGDSRRLYTSPYE